MKTAEEWALEFQQMAFGLPYVHGQLPSARHLTEFVRRVQEDARALEWQNPDLPPSSDRQHVDEVARCVHGVRWPHECKECADQAWAAHQKRLETDDRCLRCGGPTQSVIGSPGFTRCQKCDEAFPF